jgi:hypothetical protein
VERDQYKMKLIMTRIEIVDRDKVEVPGTLFGTVGLSARLGGG